MKFLKGFSTFVVSIVLTLLLIIFSLNLILKNVIEKEVFGGVIKDQVISDYIKTDEISNNNELKELLEDKDSNKIITYVITDYMEYLEDNSHQVSEKTVDSIIDFCVKHRTQISKISGEEISESEITSEKTKNDLRKSLNEGFAEVGKEFNSSALDVVKTYNDFTSTNFKIIMIISISISIVLLMIIKNSLYKWLSTFGKAIIASGLLITSLYVLINFVLNEVTDDFKLDININISGILIIGIAEIIIGISCIIIKKVIDKSNKMNNNTKYIETPSNNELQNVEHTVQEENKKDA